MCLIPILGSCNRSLYRDRFSDDPLFGGGGGGELEGGGNWGGRKAPTRHFLAFVSQGTADVARYRR